MILIHYTARLKNIRCEWGYLKLSPEKGEINCVQMNLNIYLKPLVITVAYSDNVFQLVKNNINLG